MIKRRIRLRICAAISFMLTLSCQNETAPRDAGELTAADDSSARKPLPQAWKAPHVRYPAPGSTEPFLLSETGLYRDIVSKQLALDMLEYEPEYVLWSDAADKTRWLRLPAATKIDTSEMDHWIFPRGTMLFKEFRRAGRRLETRLIARVGTGPDDYFMGSFAWNDSESDAVFVPDGKSNVRGTDHDIPEVKRCRTCHNGEQGRVLGYSAVQQPHAAAPLSERPEQPFTVPGDDLARRAVGYLHANCGNCHNERGAARADTKIILRLSTTEHDLERSQLYQSTVSVTLDYWLQKGFALRIDTAAPERSAVLARMRSRTKADAMPPFASEHVDDEGAALVASWIESLR